MREQRCHISHERNMIDKRSWKNHAKPEGSGEGLRIGFGNHLIQLTVDSRPFGVTSSVKVGAWLRTVRVFFAKCPKVVLP